MFISIFSIFIFATLLGCSAPGIGLWFTAWFCLAPLLTIIRQHRSFLKVALFGFLFGFVYNCMYLQWYLGLFPLDWLGFNDWQGWLLALAALIIASIHQAFLVAIFSLLYRLFLNLLQCNSAFLESSLSTFLQIIVVPVMWILTTNKIGNAHDLMGVPWSMLEYTQYKQLVLIQIADLIGGIGLCFLIVSINTLISQIIYELSKIFVGERTSDAVRNSSLFKKNYSRNYFFTQLQTVVSCPSLTKPLPLLGIVLMMSIAILFYGQYRLNTSVAEPESKLNSKSNTKSDSWVSIVQPNINIEMEKTEHKYSVSDLLAQQIKLSTICPKGLCVWTEGSLPIRFFTNVATQKVLKDFANRNKKSLLIGTIDCDQLNNKTAEVYNSALAISAQGIISEKIYHKRYLVPFGEYTPAFVRNWPEWILALTNTPAGTGYSSGKEATVLNVDGKLIAPLICFEIISPELAAASVRAGGQLLVNMNDLAWFHQSIIGEQMIACAVLRAVENRRDLVFAANTGPSAIIASSGKIKSYIGQNKACNLINKVNYSSKLSAFTRWFVF